MRDGLSDAEGARRPERCGGCELGLGSYARSAIRPIDATLDGLKWNSVPAADQSLFEAGLKTGTHQMLKERLGFKGELAIPIANLAVDELMKRL